MSEMEKKGIVRYEAPPIDKLPLPLQVVVRAAQHFAGKACDGADINLAWDPDAEEPYLSAWTKEGRLEVRWQKDGTLTFLFTRCAAGRYFAKRFDIETDKKTASSVVVAVAQMIITAVETLVVQIDPTLTKIFNASS